MYVFLIILTGLAGFLFAVFMLIRNSMKGYEDLFESDPCIEARKFIQECPEIKIELGEVLFIRPNVISAHVSSSIDKSTGKAQFILQTEGTRKTSYIHITLTFKNEHWDVHHYQMREVLEGV